MTTKSNFYMASRSSTPEPAYRNPSPDVRFQSADTQGYDEKSDTQSVQEGDIDEIFQGVGLLSEEVYSKTLNWWRAAVRRRIVQNVAWESKVLGRMQVCCYNSG